MNTNIIVTIAATLFLTNCSHLTEEQEQVIAAARSIEKLPIKRKEFVKAMQLADTPSENYWGGHFYSWEPYELWHHSSGLTISAHNHEKVKNITMKADSPITADSIDAIITKLENSPHPPALKEFDRFLIRTKNKTIFHSSELKLHQPTK